MIPLQLSALAVHLDGRLVGEDLQIQAVSTDSRDLPAAAARKHPAFPRRSRRTLLNPLASAPP